MSRDKARSVRRVAAPVLRLCSAVSALAVFGASAAASPDPEPRGAVEIPVELDDVPTLAFTTMGQLISSPGPIESGGCDRIASYTTANFSGSGQFFVQAGFAQGEIAAARYQLTAADFPIKINQIEVIVATSSATVQTITEWSILVWDGPPGGPATYEFSSDDLILPHIRLGPGTAAVNLQLQVDPNDPEQIVILDTRNTQSFTIGFRIDAHHQPSSNPCLIAPSSSQNAFPVVDTDGLSSLQGNWLFALDCGPFGCPPNGGWTTFGNLLAGFCRPSGDWVMRANWQRIDCQPGVGACCYLDGSCATDFQQDCDAVGGTYQGDGVKCSEVNCPIPRGACCNPAGGCADDLTEAQCVGFGGVWAGAGTFCPDACLDPCPADLNGDGVVDADDFFLFLQLFADGDPAADINGDGVIDADDFFGYLGLFADGC